MLGKGEPYDRVPYFFSDQYDLGMEYSGHATEWDQVVFRGDPASREFIAFWLKDGPVLIGMNVMGRGRGHPAACTLRQDGGDRTACRFRRGRE